MLPATMSYVPGARDYALLFSLVLMWGTAFLATSVGVREVGPESLVVARVAIAATLLVPAVWWSGASLPHTAGMWARFAVLAFVGNALPFTLISWGQERVASSLAGILMAVMPLATLVLAHFFVAGERMTRVSASGFALGFAGVVVLIGPDALLELGGEASDLLRQGAVLAGALCYATNTIIARRMPETPPLVSAAATMCMATLWMLPLVAWTGPVWPTSGAGAFAVVWLGVVATALATIVYFRIVSTAGPTFLSTINYQIPVVALLVGVGVGGESIDARVIVALAMILGGLALGTQRA